MTHTVIDKRKSQLPTANHAVLCGGPADSLKIPIKGELPAVIAIPGQHGYDHKTRTWGMVRFMPALKYAYRLFHIQDGIAYYEIDGREGNVGA